MTKYHKVHAYMTSSPMHMSARVIVSEYTGYFGAVNVGQ